MLKYPKFAKLPVICAFIALLFVNMGIAQQEQEQVTLQFVTFPKWTTREPIQMAIGNGEFLDLTVPSNSFSKPYQVPKLTQWMFGKPKVDEEGKPSFEIYGQGASLASKNQLIILIRKGKNPSDGLKVIAVDNQLSKFGGGDFYFLNTSNFDVAGVMGKNKFVMKPAGEKLVKLKPEDLHSHEGMQFVQTVLFYQDNEKSNPFFSSTWPANPKARSMIFFYHSGNNNRIRMHTIQDYLP